MNLLDYWNEGVRAMEHSKVFKGAEYLGISLLGFILAVLILLLFTIILRRFFRRHPLVTKAHRILIYLLTMSGVALLILAGILGLLLPIIPGIPLLLAGLLLMRKYHKWGWLEAQIASWKRKVRAYRHRRAQRKAQAQQKAVRQNKRRVRQHSDKL